MINPKYNSIANLDIFNTNDAYEILKINPMDKNSVDNAWIIWDSIGMSTNGFYLWHKQFQQRNMKELYDF